MPNQVKYRDLFFRPGEDWQGTLNEVGKYGWVVVSMFVVPQIQNPTPTLVGAPPRQGQVAFFVAGVVLMRQTDIPALEMPTPEQVDEAMNLALTAAQQVMDEGARELGEEIKLAMPGDEQPS